MTTLRPLGPSVTLTASARRLTPRSSARRASSSNSKLLAMSSSYLRFWMAFHCFMPPPRARHSAGPGRCWTRWRVHRLIRWLLLDDGQHVAGGQHEVADAHVHRDALGACVVEPARTDRKNLALLGLLLGGVRDDQAGRGGLLGFERAHHDPVFKRLENNLGGGRHDLTSPSGKG